MEILAEIWGLLKTSPASLGRIVQVSRGWNKATDISILWAAPHITEKTELHLLHTHISRTNKSDLTISIDFGRSADSVFLHQPVEQDSATKFIAIMDILTPSSHRWRSFEVFGPHYLHLLLKPVLVASLPVPKLTRISINLERPLTPHFPGAAPADSLFQSNPSLRDVEILGYPLPWETFAFQTVTSLTLGPFTDQNILTWNTFAVAVGGSRNLCSLAFCGVIPSIHPMLRPPGEMLQTLALPALTSLSLAHLTGNDLQHLLRFLVASQLAALALRLTNEQEEYLPFLQDFPRCFPQLVTLAIESVWLGEVSQLALSSFLTQLPTLINLHLNFDNWNGLTNSFWHALITQSGNPQFLPTLKNIFLVDTPLLSVQDLVLLRERASKPLSNVSVHCSEYPADHEWPPAETTWIMDHTAHFVLTGGHKNPWVRGFGGVPDI